MKILRMILAILAATFAMGSVMAGEESPFYGRLDLQYQKTKNKDEQLSLFGKILYGEYLVTEKVSVTGTVYHDKEFRGVYAGLAYQATDELQLGLATGRVKYDDRDWTVWNPWAYFESGDYKMLLYAEWYPKDREEPRWFKGYLEKKLSERFSGGVYGDSTVGLGPMLAFYFNKQARIWGTVPVTLKPHEGEMLWMVGFTYEF